MHASECRFGQCHWRSLCTALQRAGSASRKKIQLYDHRNDGDGQYPANELLATKVLIGRRPFASDISYGGYSANQPKPHGGCKYEHGQQGI